MRSVLFIDGEFDVWFVEAKAEQLKRGKAVLFAVINDEKSYHDDDNASIISSPFKNTI